MRGKSNRLRWRQQARLRLITTLLTRDGNLCQICQKKLNPDDLTIDHIVPISLAGSNLDDNLQLAHGLCNRQKGGPECLQPRI